MRVVDEKQIGRHYTASDLAELFTYTPSPLPLAGTQPAKPYERPEVGGSMCTGDIHVCMCVLCACMCLCKCMCVCVMFWGRFAMHTAA